MCYSDNPMLYVTILTPIVSFASKRMGKREATVLKIAFTAFTIYSAFKSRQQKVA